MGKVSAAVKRRSGWWLLLIGAAALAALLLGLRTPAQSAASPTADTPAYMNASLPTDQRVQDLLSRMTLKEKVGQMGQINVEVLQGVTDTPWDRGPLNPDLMNNVLNDNNVLINDLVAIDVLSGGDLVIYVAPSA